MPHDKMLAPYMNSNLAQQARAWMGSCLLTGTQLILPPVLESYTNHCVIPTSAQSSPYQLIHWEVAVTGPTTTPPTSPAMVLGTTQL
jgi:hypothetical protein